MKILAAIVLLLCVIQTLCRQSKKLHGLPQGSNHYFPAPIAIQWQRQLQRSHNSERSYSTDDVGSPLLLTPYIEQGKLTEAREAAYVSPDVLPGIKSYAGYLTVNKIYNANLWFWYFPVQGKPVEDTPWIIWLQGGPGASSLFGLFTEIGPLFVTKGKKLEEMKYSWGKNHSLLFIDNPVGTGYSFTDDKRGYAMNQTTIGENLYNALQQFLTIFPELRKAPLTIAGESYAGKHIPSIGVQILWHKSTDEPINLQGLAIGNGYIDPRSLQRLSAFVREVGLIDDRFADMMEKLETQVVKYIDEDNIRKALVYSYEDFGEFRDMSQIPNAYNYLQDSDPTEDHAFENFIDMDEVRKALHVGNTDFTTHGEVYSRLQFDMMTSVKKWLEELLEHYRVMVFSGHLDTVVPYHASVNTYKSLNFSGAKEYNLTERKLWIHDGKLAGYYKVGGNLTEVMVRGAGHMVPTDKPAEALGLISAFVRGVPLDEDTGNFISV